MQEQHIFEYAVIRVVPRVEREEFINIGVVLYCSKQRFLQVRFLLKKEMLAQFCPQLDTDILQANLLAFEKICAGGKTAGPIGGFSIAERFRWLTATRSTVIQSSKVHPGFCTDALATLEKLFEQLVA